jgi:hypothetical protein
MKLYLRVITENKYHKKDPEQIVVWERYSGVGHAMWDKQAMTEKEICWEYMKQDLDNCPYDHNYFECDHNATQFEMVKHLLKTMEEIQHTVRNALNRLIRVGLVKEL